MSATPTFWRSFVASCGSRAGLIPLRQITLGGEIADQRTLELLRQAFPEASLTHIYASTEAGNVFSVKDGRAGFPASWLNTGIDDVQLRISDGVLQVKSPRAMIAKTAEECESVEANGGWIQTGDLVEIRGDRVMFLGRKDTLINVGGFKVIPEEVERIILEVPGIVQARVYGCPNPVTGNVVGTEIVLSGVDQSEILPKLQATLASKLDRYKCPRIIKFIEQIPESDTGKVSRTL